MSPTLERYIRLARYRICGTPLTREIEQGQQESEAIKRFQDFLTRKIDLEVRLELYSETVWRCDQGSCSLQFTVDSQQFVLVESPAGYRLYRRADAEDRTLALLEDNQDFQDRLLIAIDDGLHPGEGAGLT